MTDHVHDNFNDTVNEFTYTGQVDSQRGRGVYSSAEKAYEQFNQAALVRERNVQFTEDERQFRLRVAEEEHNLRMRHAETEHQLFMGQLAALNIVSLRLVNGGATTEELASRELLEQLATVMAKTTDLTPPVKTS